jgi:hypothetical protein
MTDNPSLAEGRRAKRAMQRVLARELSNIRPALRQCGTEGRANIRCLVALTDWLAATPEHDLATLLVIFEEFESCLSGVDRLLSASAPPH